MKRARTWLAVLLALALALGALPMAALAEEDVWLGAAEVENFEQFQAALADEKVPSVRIAGDVTVTGGTLEEPLAADKPILVTQDGRLALAPGAVMSSDVGMGLLSYEDSGDPDVSLWDRIADGMEAFLLWEDGGSVYRLLCGSQEDGLAALDSGEYGELSTAVFKSGVRLDGPVEAGVFFVMDGDLTIGGSLQVRMRLFVSRDLTVEDGGSLELGEGGGWVEGDVNLLGADASMPEGLDCGGERNYPHLLAKWGEDDYGEEIFMTPYDEHEVSFVLRSRQNEVWGYADVTPTVSAPLAYGTVEGHDVPTLTARDADWGETYEVRYESYSLPVHIELPQLGCYSSPNVTVENFLTNLPGSPLSDGEFYVCVNPDEWFVEEGWEISDTLEVRPVRYGEGGETVIDGAVACERVREGVWKVKVTECDINPEFTATVTNPEDEGNFFEIGTGLGIWPEEWLVCGDAPLNAEESEWGIPWQDAFRASLHSTLALKTGSGKDVPLYLLVYHGEPEEGMSAGWYCEPVGVEGVRGDGVTVSEGKDGQVRVTAQSTGTHQVVRLQDEETDGEWRPVPGSTRGVPLPVSVTSSGGSGSGGSGSGGSSGGVVKSGTTTTGGTAYAVSVPSGLTGGTVSVQPQNANKGATVTITVRPEDGYELSALTVTAADGKAVSTTEAGAGRYTFLMPGSKVTVQASFTKAAAEPQATGSRFTDVAPGSYYYDAVEWAVEEGITGGRTADQFSPDSPCSRAQVITFLWRAAGSPAPSSRETSFRDAQPGAYYYDAVLWAVEQGITGGRTADTFSPEDTVTRGQTAAFLHRAAGSPAASGHSFADVSPESYYAEAVQWAAEKGITGGTGGGMFQPGANCTRAQIVTFLYRSQKN